MKQQSFGDSRGRIEKVELETAGGPELSGKFATPWGGEGAGAGIGVNAIYVKKWKRVRDWEGFLTNGETTRQTTVKAAVMSSIVSPALKTRLRDDKVLTEQFRKLLALVDWREDVIAVTYALDDTARKTANALLGMARAAKSAGDSILARQLKEEGQAIVSNEKNYRPTRISLIPTQVDREDLVNLDLFFLKWSTHGESKLEKRLLVLTIP